MASAKNKGQATETPDSVEAQPNAGKQAGNDDYGRITDLFAYQSLAGSAAIIGQAVRAVAQEANAPKRVLLLDDWNLLKGSALVAKVDAALAFHADQLARSKKEIDDSLARAGVEKVASVAAPDEQAKEIERQVAPTDFADILANLKSLHDLLQPTIEFAARDLSFDADAVRSAVAGALVTPEAKGAKVTAFIPSLRQVDLASLPLLKRLQQATAARETLCQALAEGQKWLEGNPDSLQKKAVENAVKSGNTSAKTFDDYLEELLKIEPPILEQALMHQTAVPGDVTHLLAVKPVLAVTQTTRVRAFPLLDEYKRFGASVLAYTLTTTDGQVRAAGIANADKTETDQPHPANQLMALLLGVVALVLTLFVLLSACSLSVGGLKVLMTVVSPRISATATQTATPAPATPGR